MAALCNYESSKWQLWHQLDSVSSYISFIPHYGFETLKASWKFFKGWGDGDKGVGGGQTAGHDLNAMQIKIQEDSR